MKYFLAIDFGNAYTKAVYASVPEIGKEPVIRYVNIRKSNDIEGKKVFSHIMCSTAGRYGLDVPSGDLILSLKDNKNPSASHNFCRDNHHVLFGIFIRDVITMIRNNHADDIFAGRNEVALFITVPELWGEDEKIRFKSLVEQSSGLKAEGVMDECDAAYCCWTDETFSSGTVLVVDYSADAIDFALMEGGLRKYNMSIGYGAGKMDDILMEIYGSSDAYKKTMTLALTSLKKNCNTWIDLEPWLKTSIRKSREQAYNVSDDYISGNWRMDEATGLDEDHNIIFEYEFIESCLNSYKEQVRNGMEAVRDQISGMLGGKSPDSVILCGGGANMSWVRALVRDVWKDSERIVMGEYPSYMAAEGILQYALGLENNRLKIKKLLSEQNCYAIYEECDKLAKEESIRDFFHCILRKAFDSGQRNTEALLDVLLKSVDDLSHNIDFTVTFKKKFQINLSIRINHVISDIVADVWGENSRTHVDMSKIYSFPFLMGELRISPDDIQRAKFKMFMELKIMDFLRLTGIDRPSIKEYADAMVTGFSKASLIPFIRISDNDLKSIIIEEVMRIFNKKLLFKKY